MSLRTLVLSLCLLAAWPVLAENNAVEAMSQARPNSDARSRAKIHTELGSLYFQDGNMAVALEETRIALQADSSYAPAYTLRALVHAYLRELEQAETDFRRALNLAPQDPEINNNYGWFLCENGKEKQGIPYFLAALKNPLYTTPERAYANAGSCALKTGDMAAAEDYLVKALRIARHGEPNASFLLAEIHYRKGKLDEARQKVSEALRLFQQPASDVLWLALRIERKLGNRGAEAEMASRLRKEFPNSREYQDFLKGNFE